MVGVGEPTGFLDGIDAKIDPVAADVKQLVSYMILHEGKIARLEERTKNL